MLETRAVIDQELNELPWKYRVPLILCYLEGHTNEEAGRLLGWPVGTVKGRLSRARELLRGRLTRRGLTLSAGALTAALSAATASPAPAAPLVLKTVSAATLVAAADTLAGAVPGFTRSAMAVCTSARKLFSVASRLMCTVLFRASHEEKGCPAERMPRISDFFAA